VVTQWDSQGLEGVVTDQAGWAVDAVLADLCL
jgi:hypothetical protein